MPNYSEAVYAVNDYLLNNPELAALLKYAGTGLKPIFPAQEPREANDPYIRYIVRTTADRDMWFTYTGEVTYFVYSASIPLAGKIISKIGDLLGRQDESALEMQSWFQSRGGTNWIFHSAEYIASISPNATTQEGGKHRSSITIRIKYNPATIRQTNY